MKKITRTIETTKVVFHTFDVSAGAVQLSDAAVEHLEGNIAEKPDKVKKELEKLLGTNQIIIDSTEVVVKKYEMSVADFIKNAKEA